MARVLLTPSAAEELDALPVVAHVRVLKVIDRLASWPDVSGAKPLRGALKGQYRIRTGDYRVQFAVSGKGADAAVTVVKIEHRDGFYDE
ncbi:MAG: type II toxin-antitoxin system RelE/ParE family toxin [Phycisphaeraceae bacterium]|nr:type II toxin-antitoxin system RelE/ParE family toxin [Phycisphaeraceae bacterium]